MCDYTWSTVATFDRRTLLNNESPTALSHPHSHANNISRVYAHVGQAINELLPDVRSDMGVFHNQPKDVVAIGV